MTCIRLKAGSNRSLGLSAFSFSEGLKRDHPVIGYLETFVRVAVSELT